MNQGWVYVFVNSSFPGYAKVGRTQRSPEQRAQELSAATGVPTPFVLAFEQYFVDCVAAEHQIHAELDRRGMRINQHREFFHASVAEIIRIMLDLADRLEPASVAAPAPCGERLFLMAEQTLHGAPGCLQDGEEALRLFKLAIARGSLAAFERVGQIHAAIYAARSEPGPKRRALAIFKEGARRGNYYCLTGMAQIFAADGHAENAVKAWGLFFERRAAAFRPDLEQQPSHYAAALASYIGAVHALGLRPAHMAELKGATGSVMAWLLDRLDGARADPQACRRITETLRWAYENLLQPTLPPAPKNQKLPVPAPSWVRTAARELA